MNATDPLTDPPFSIHCARQPDGLLHVVLGRDCWRSICGLQLKRYETLYANESWYASQPHRCPQCVAILARRAKFPERTSEELKGRYRSHQEAVGASGKTDHQRA
jgi:hypothetical protein